MPPGTLLYRTSNDGKMFGYSSDPLLVSEKGILKNIYAGHVAMYIGQENGEDYIVEAMSGGIVKTPAKYFLNSANHEVFLGAKIPRAASQLQIAKVVALARSLIGKKLGYDYDFKIQKGPGDGEWTCVGLTEKLYESANILNPNDLAGLEYNPERYAVDITPDGFDNYSLVNSAGDCFSTSREFSKIARRADLLIPASELVGYDVGLERAGERYIFLPYTQFLQPTLATVTPDINLATAFNDETVRGSLNITALVLRWSLINNPWSALQNIYSTVKNFVVAAADKTVAVANSLGSSLFGSNSDTAVVLSATNLTSSSKTSSKNSATATKTTKAKTKKSSTAAEPKSSVAGSLPTIIVNSVAGNKSTQDNQAAKSSTSTVTKASTAKSTTKNKTASSTAATSYYSPAVASSAASSGSVSQSSTGSGSGDNWQKLAKINKIYATGDNDWVELINTTDQDFDLAAAGYRLERAKTAVDPSLIMRLGDLDDGSYPGGTIIKAHGTYLIVNDQVDNYYRSRADAIATREEFAWTGSGYTLYLGVGAISSNADADIVDAVGFGADATYFQGDGPAPEITNAYVLNRVGNAGNNRLDFNLILSDDPDRPTVTEATGSEVTSTASTATSTDQTNGSENATSTTSTASSTEATGDSTEETDAAAATSTIWSKLVLLNKIYATGDNDWVELFNYSDQDLDLASANYRLEKSVTAIDPSLIMRIGNTADGSYPGGTIIKAHDKYLIVRDQTDSYYKTQADAIATRDDFGWSGSGYTLYLGNGAISSNTDPNITDLVGFGPDATYWQGSRPAVTITDNYILNRLATSSNNFTDFNLIKSDDPNIIIDNNPDDNLDLFVPPTPITSPGLTDLWHFDECYGAGTWVIGRWDCAREVGVNHAQVTLPLSTDTSLNAFSASFYYKKAGDYARAQLRLSSSASDDNLNLVLEPGMVTVEGLPNSQWRYYVNVPFDDDWHQATLVINQAEDYWAVYIDGREVISEKFMARLATMTEVELSGNCSPAWVDELAIWNRPLTAAEIRENFDAAAPFSPIIARTPQTAAQLRHAWDFEEDTGSLAVDGVGQTTLTVAADAWAGRQHNNYALTIKPNQDISVDLDENIISQDLSITTWWRNSSYPNPGRANINLLGGTDGQTRLFSLLADDYRLGYWFNGGYGIIAEGVDKFITNDDAWHHLALVYDSYRYRLSLYVDGVVQASSSLIWMKPEESISRLLINSDTSPAEIDDLRIYQGALSAKQIKDIYTKTK
jgi:hypothetical protein